MATNLDIDPKLIEEAQRLGEHRTKKAAVTEALEEFIRRRKQLKIVDLFDKIEYYPDYDPKQSRRKR